jgi:hypothetical protein
MDQLGSVLRGETELLGQIKNDGVGRAVTMDNYVLSIAPSVAPNDPPPASDTGGGDASTWCPRSEFGGSAPEQPTQQVRTGPI